MLLEAVALQGFFNIHQLLFLVFKRFGVRLFSQFFNQLVDLLLVGLSLLFLSDQSFVFQIYISLKVQNILRDFTQFFLVLQDQPPVFRILFVGYRYLIHEQVKLNSLLFEIFSELVVKAVNSIQLFFERGFLCEHNGDFQIQLLHFVCLIGILILKCCDLLSIGLTLNYHFIDFIPLLGQFNLVFLELAALFLQLNVLRFERLILIRSLPELFLSLFEL